MRRLYLQLYLAFLVVAAVGVGAAAAAAHALIGSRDEVPPPLAAAAHWLVASMPAEPAARQAYVSEAAGRLGLELAVTGPDGALIAQSAPVPDGPTGWFGGRGYTGLRARTADGHEVAAVLRRGWGPGSPAWIVSPILLFGVMAAGCYPVARRITRRLEALRATSERWAQGELGARAAVRGQDEVAELAIAFNEAAGRVEALVTAQRRLLANASHELRSPLSRLRMALALLDDEGDAERQALHAEAGRDIEELDALIGDLLLGARLEAAPDGPADRSRWAEVDLGALAQDEAGRVGALVTGPGFRVQGDAVLLRRLLRNLLENARRYAGDEVSVGFEGRAIVVADRGPGVAPEHREAIWEPFWRPPGHAEAAGGVGLGLSLVRQIARHHGATARYEPREGGGSRFVVRWPEGA